MSDLTTLANVKSWINITGSSDDAVLKRLITAASLFIEGVINRTIAQASYTDTRDGTGGIRMPFLNFPVTAVASLSIDGVAIPASTGPAVSGYVFSETLLSLRGYSFNRGFQNVVMQYTAGFLTTPVDIEQACIETVALRYRERDRIGHQSKSIAGETVTFFIGDLPASAKSALQQYKRVVPL